MTTNHPPRDPTPAVADILERVDRNTDDWWKACALAGVEHLAATGTPFTAYDVAALGVPEPDHPNRWGAVMNIAARAGTIRAAGYVPSPRPTVHRSVVRQWIGAQDAPHTSPPKEPTMKPPGRPRRGRGHRRAVATGTRALDPWNPWEPRDPADQAQDVDHRPSAQTPADRPSCAHCGAPLLSPRSKTSGICARCTRGTDR